MDFRQTRVVVLHDLASAYRRVAVILTLAFFGFFWYFVLKWFNEGIISAIEEHEEFSFIFFWFFEEIDPDQLSLAPSTFLFLYSFVAFQTTHLFVIIMTSDQTASDIGNRYFRYLVTRCGRTELFTGRLISVLIITLLTITLGGIAALLTIGFADGELSSKSISFSLRTALWLFLLCLPFVSLSAMISAWSGSVAISMLCTSAIALVFPKIFDLIELKWKHMDGIEHLRSFFPGGVTDSVLGGNANSLTVIVPIAYLVVFGWIGCWLFRTREFL